MRPGRAHTGALLIAAALVAAACSSPAADDPRPPGDSHPDDDADDAATPERSDRGRTYDGDAGEVDTDRLDVTPTDVVPAPIADRLELPASFAPTQRTVAADTGTVSVTGTVDAAFDQVVAELDATLAAGDFASVETTVDTPTAVTWLALADGGNAGAQLDVTAAGSDRADVQLRATWFDLPSG